MNVQVFVHYAELLHPDKQETEQKLVAEEQSLLPSVDFKITEASEGAVRQRKAKPATLVSYSSNITPIISEYDLIFFSTLTSF